MRLLTRTTITGKENFPEAGPLILVGNHVAMIEVVMMVLYAPYLAEMIAAGDIPLDPRFAALINAYGMIPINRGNIDRDGLNMALAVLEQKGVVGIFPEGGIWETALKQGRTGVAWLSYKSGAPILPIGFGGIEGALGAALRFKRPRLTMNVGPLIPAIHVDGKNRKQALEEGARLVMSHINRLIPEEDKHKSDMVLDESFGFVLLLQDSSGAQTPAQIPHSEALGQFFYRPILLNTLARNVKLPVQPLQNLDSEHNPQRIASAAQAILAYLSQNPYFLSYRFGYETASAMQTALDALCQIALQAAQNEQQLFLTPLRRYRLHAGGDEIVETGIGKAHGM